ncbi:lytic transglycosylase domain-containing protein [Altererythrobacter arenosus]|uniref:Lytic transglycosylase domain-containing protein n=1 Tax=Altererythrobacter arenosus TaxID=3032592 RepID=A0ABY8FXI8_9SPHN|nr:lytic transglycosylase domain-containing protein [Altererythrobacter sp. CAU 1644]WFL76729.1 lytic transglycosylase domain-containing protein [Altererythrobacter sp. CAU 1644]
MVRKSLICLALAGTSALALTAPVAAQDRVQMTVQPTNTMSLAVSQWEYLTKSDSLGFADYSSFVLRHPGFPKEALLRTRAENALDRESPSSQQLVAFFDRNPPLTNTGRARYALALQALGRPEAREMAREAWRSGVMGETAEAYLVGMFSSSFTQEDHDARMEALLWQGAADAAKRHQSRISSAKRGLASTRLTLLEDEFATGEVEFSREALQDPGAVYNLVRHYRKKGKIDRAISILSSRPTFAIPAHDGEDFIAEALTVAKSASTSQAVAIASKVDDVFAPGTDISEGSFRLRDKYTDLMWLGGTKALWSMGNGRSAAPLFYRYGMAAKTPLTRSKGLYWAGRAARQGGDEAKAREYFAAAGKYADQYYGQLSLDAIGQKMPQFVEATQVPPTEAEKSAFKSDPLVQALRAIAKGRRDWRTERAYFETLAEKADTAGKMALVADLARELNLNEFAVVAGATAPENGLFGFERLGHPTVSVPYGTDWTMAHAIMRQESEFDRNRVSHAGARGMMQLMPGTAREQAGKMGMNYMSASLTEDPQYNIRLGDAYFRRLMDYYGGAYPLAIGAYNAGPGRVNQWLRANGDPRTGAIDYVTWIEKIPANFETRYYIMRVLGNAVTYDNMHPNRAPGGKPRTIADFLR